jgi:LysM domain
MQITHAEARKLIQFSIEQTLSPQEIKTLRVHLEDCVECRVFAEELKEVESILVPLMKRQWSLQPAPLSIPARVQRKSINWQTNIMLATRTAMISIVFAAFVFSAWQFTRSVSRTSTPVPISILPIPTPSGQSTSTKVSFQNCAEKKYQVQENDTLESIASQFSVSKDKIMAVNNMHVEMVYTKMELWIPICHSTPTGTVHPSTLTITFTPLIGPTTSTPGG